MPTTIINWNVAWARPGTPRGKELLRRIFELEPDVICLTEGYTDFLPPSGHLIAASADYGYDSPPGRRKVLLWSRQPWEAVDQLGSPALPGGRFIAGTTGAGRVAVRFVGICVPWRDAHVRTGRRNRRPWEEHLTYLRGLTEFLADGPHDRTVLLGDFNQTIPRTRAPTEAFELLTGLRRAGFSFATESLRDSRGRLTIDQIAVGKGLTISALACIDNRTDSGALSDHFGLSAALAGPPGNGRASS